MTDAAARFPLSAAGSRFASRVLQASVTSLAMGAVGFLSGPLAARLLGPTGRGELAAIQAWPLVLTSLSALGLHEATIYFAARAPARGARLLGSATFLALLASVPVMAAGYLLMPLLLHAQSAAVVSMGRLYLLAIPLSALTAMPLGALRGRQDMLTWNLLRLLPPVAWLGLLCLALVTGRTSPAWVAGAFLVASAGLAAVTWSVARSRVGGSLWPNTRDWRPMLRYGLPTMASQTPMALTLRFDQMILAALLEPRVLGLYAVAMAWSNAMGPVLSGVGYVVFPMVAAEADATNQRKVLARGARMGVALAIAAALILGPLAPIAIPRLFGADFAAAVPAAFVLVAAAAVASVTGILRDGARGLGATGAVLASEVAALVAGVVVLIVLLRPAGIMGAALAALTGYATGAAMLCLAIRRRTGSPLRELLIPRRHEFTAAIAQVRRLALVRRDVDMAVAPVTTPSEARPPRGAPAAVAEALILCPTLFGVRNVLHSQLLPALEQRGLRARVLVRPGTTVAGSAGALVPAQRRGRLATAALRALDLVHHGAFFARYRLNNDALTMWWYRRGEARPRRLVVTLLERAGAAIGPTWMYRYVERSTDWIRRHAWDLEPHREELRRHSPSVVVATSGIDELEEPYVMAARDLGIPTLGCIQSFDHLTGRSRLVSADQYAVWNERMRDQLLRLHPDRSAAVAVTGTAQFDFHRQGRFRWDRGATLAHLGLNQDDRYLLYAANTFCQAPSEPDLVSALARRCAADPTLRYHRIVVRLHPLDDFARWQAQAGADERIVLSRPCERSEEFTDAAEQARLVSTLAHADVCINMWSSMSLDAAALDTPVVCVAFSGGGRGPEEQFCRDVYRVDFYAPIVASGGVRLARDLDTLVSETARAVADPARDRTLRAALATSECGPLDGQSACRIADAVAGLAAASRGGAA
ncbi:MAG TPA: oligosaccharide flippase family protein [Gemmatimonadales bacterium]|jgi:O-antigen/teichoic acid export membrane protein|nr:oligosaccharide flippase family protein [Gemmatimonadales bacterium]